MKTSCSKCGKSFDAIYSTCDEGKILCKDCAPEITLKKQAIEQKLATLHDKGFKEDITPNGITRKRYFDVEIKNVLEKDIEWLSIGVITYSRKHEARTVERVSDGNTVYSQQFSTWKDIYKQDYQLIKSPLVKSQTATFQNMWINDCEREETFAGIEIYNAYGAFTDGETFNILFQKKIEFDSSGSAKAPGCFVTTAAFGNPNHPMVEDFRYFRDNFLIHSNKGKRFIHWYNENGPLAANYIERHPRVKALTRYALIPIAIFIRKYICSRNKM